MPHRSAAYAHELTIEGASVPGKEAAADVRDAAGQAEIIILGVPSDVLEEVARGLGDLTGKIVIDVSGGSKRVADQGYLELVSDSTNAERLQSRHPTARVVRIMIPTIVYFVQPLLAGAPPTVPIAGQVPLSCFLDVAELFGFGRPYDLDDVPRFPRHQPPSHLAYAATAPSSGRPRRTP
jgi:hypothetical protein